MQLIVSWGGQNAVWWWQRLLFEWLHAALPSIIPGNCGVEWSWSMDYGRRLPPRRYTERQWEDKGHGLVPPVLCFHQRKESDPIHCRRDQKVLRNLSRTSVAIAELEAKIRPRSELLIWFLYKTNRAALQEIGHPYTKTFSGPRLESPLFEPRVPRVGQWREVCDGKKLLSRHHSLRDDREPHEDCCSLKENSSLWIYVGRSLWTEQPGSMQIVPL